MYEPQWLSVLSQMYKRFLWRSSLLRGVEKSPVRQGRRVRGKEENFLKSFWTNPFAAPAHWWDVLFWPVNCWTVETWTWKVEQKVLQQSIRIPSHKAQRGAFRERTKEGQILCFPLTTTTCTTGEDNLKQFVLDQTTKIDHFRLEVVFYKLPHLMLFCTIVVCSNVKCVDLTDRPH